MSLSSKTKQLQTQLEGVMREGGAGGRGREHKAEERRDSWQQIQKELATLEMPEPRWPATLSLPDHLLKLGFLLSAGKMVLLRA